MKKIPKSFILGGHTIEVRRVSEKEMLQHTGGEACYGLFSPSQLLILVLRATKKIKADFLMQTFWHEYAHALLWVQAHKDTYNEKVVDQLGHALKQTHDSFEF